MGAWSNKEYGDVRREYDLKRMGEENLPEDPLMLFGAWMQKATTAGILDPTAMTLSTVDNQGNPSTRIVLLKKIDQDRLVFFTNYHSRKAKEIRTNSKVAAHFYWSELERQVKISGVAQALEDADSDQYFSSRPFESKVSAWVSPQSEVVPNREYLENEYQRYLKKFESSGEVPRPDYWGGFAISPRRMEFWQGGRHRLHDRIEYKLDESGWSFVRLAP